MTERWGLEGRAGAWGWAVQVSVGERGGAAGEQALGICGGGGGSRCGSLIRREGWGAIFIPLCQIELEATPVICYL